MCAQNLPTAATDCSACNMILISKASSQCSLAARRSSHASTTTSRPLDVFVGAADRVVSTGGFLKREETLVLVESVTSVEQAIKVLELITRHLANRADMDANDWHHRKQYYMRLCEITTKMGRPEAVLALFGNLQRFQVATYFGREAVATLAPLGAHPAVLLRIAELCKMQRGPADKGVRAAYAEVVEVLAARGQPGDAELLPKAKADLKALRSSVVKLEAPAAAAAVAAVAAVAEAVAV